MKRQIWTIVGLSTAAWLLAAPAQALDCQPVSQYASENGQASGERLDCKISTSHKIVHVLKLKGNFVQNAYTHGYLLSHEAKDGLLTIWTAGGKLESKSLKI